VEYWHYRVSRRRREKGKENLLEEIMVENFSSLMNYINLHVQEAELTPSRINVNPHPDTLCPKNA